MPYIGTRLVDEDGIALLREWIAQLPASSSHASNKELESLRVSLVKPDTDLQELAARESGSTSAALRLAHATSHPSVPVERREKLARAVLKTSNPLVRELFERFVPADERTPISQAIAPKQEVLSLKGDPQRGAALLSDTARLSCLQCHQYQNLGRTFGPPFKKAVANKSRGEILDNIIAPSRQIAPEYVLYTADLGDDDPISGMIVTRNDQEVVLKDAALAEHRIATAKIKSLKAQQLSAMPEGLLAGLSAQQVADLLEALMTEAK